MTKIKTLIKTNRKIAFTAVLLLLVGVGTYFIFRPEPPLTNPAKTSGNQQTINLRPPTDKEKSTGDSVKPSIVKQEEVRNAPAETTPSSKRVVTPVITYAEHINPQNGGQIEVGGYVNGVFEGDGICTLTLSLGNIAKSVSVTGVKGANSVDCPVMSLNRSSLSVGTWSAVVSYTSASSEGVSAARAVRVE